MKFLRKVQAMAIHGSGQTFADTSRYDPYKGFRFEVEITGGQTFAKAGFQKVSGLNMSTEVTEYREGGDSDTVSKTPGLTKFDALTLERGMSDDADMWNWSMKLFDFNSVNQKNTGYRANMKIKLKDRQGNVVKIWEVPNAWVSEYKTGEFDAQSNNILIETITVQHEGWYRSL